MTACKQKTVKKVKKGSQFQNKSRVYKHAFEKLCIITNKNSNTSLFHYLWQGN